MPTTLEFTGFASATQEAKELPKLNCLGYVESVGEAHVTAPKEGRESGDYIRIPVTIGATQGGKKGFIGLLFRPEWLRPDFNYDALAAEDNGTTFQIVYKMNIGGARDKATGKITQLSVLMGLAGSEENFSALAGQIWAGIEGKEDSEVPVIVRDILANFVAEVNPEIGYYSTQKKEGPKGAKVAVPGNREISGYFFPSLESDKRNLNDAARGKSIMAYDAG